MEKPATHEIESATTATDIPEIESDASPSALDAAMSLVENLPKQASRSDLSPIIEHLARVDDEISVGMVIKEITDHAAFKSLGRQIRKEVTKLRAKYHAEAEARAHEAAQQEATKAKAEAPTSAQVADAKVDYTPLNYFKDKGYAVAQVGDKVVIMQPPRITGYRPRKHGLPEPIFEPTRFLSKEGFKLKYCNKLFEDKDGNFDPAAERWLESKHRLSYDAVVSVPYGLGKADPTNDNVYNLFTGYKITGNPPAGASCQLFLDHLFHNICRGNQEYYEWLVSWIAHMLRDPSNKQGTAVVLRGEQGTGKSKVGEVLSQLYFPWNAVSVSKPAHVMGQFAIIDGNVVLCVAEEALFAGDKSKEGPLKDVIASPTMVVEYKHVSPIQTSNNAHFLLITNNDWCIPASAREERRYFVLDVSDEHANDHAYFAAIDEQLANGGLEALARFLLDWKQPEHVNLRKAPVTDALREQAQYSESPAIRCLRAMLSGGGIQVDKETLLPIWDASELAAEQKRGSGLGGFSRGAGGVLAGDGGMLVPKELMRQAFVYFARQNGLRPSDMTDVGVGKALAKAGVTSDRKKQGKDGVAGNAQYYKLPPFEDMCATFEAKVGSL